MKTLLLLLAIFITYTSHCPLALSAIFYPDSRIESPLQIPSNWLEISRSVGALVPKNRLQKRLYGWQMTGNTLTDINLCLTERFSDQKIIANCSSSLIAKDIVLTAAHCLERSFVPNSIRNCSNYAVVFDYYSNSENPYFVHDDNIFFCEEVIYHQYPPPFDKEDLALIRINRPVLNRTPISLSFEPPNLSDSLVMIGHPLGIFQKFVDNGEVLKVNEANLSFRHNLDSFSVNSGGPIFDSYSMDQVGVLVRGTGGNFAPLSNSSSCSTWAIANENDYAEGNFLKSIEETLKLIK